MIRADKIKYEINDDNYVIRVYSYFSNLDFINQYSCNFLYYSDTKRGYLSCPFNEEYNEMDVAAKKKFTTELEDMFGIEINNMVQYG